jgi:hypothetical protein
VTGGENRLTEISGKRFCLVRPKRFGWAKVYEKIEAYNNPVELL